MSNEIKIDGRRQLAGYGTVKVSGAAITSQNVVGGAMVQSIPGVYIFTPSGAPLADVNTIVKMTTRQSPAFQGSAGVATSNVTFNTFDATAAAAARNFDFEIWQILPG